MALPRLLPVLALAILALLAAPLSPSASASRRVSRPQIKKKLPLPRAGNVTLAKVKVTVRAKRGRRLPRRLKLKARVKSGRRLGRSVNIFFGAGRVKRKRGGRSASLVGLVAILRPKAAASSEIVPVRAGPTQSPPSELGLAALFLFSEGLPFLGSPDWEVEGDIFDDPGDSPVCPGVESVLGDIGKPVQIAAAFSPRQNLRYAFAAGCGTPSIRVPGGWFDANGLDRPAGSPTGPGGSPPEQYTKRVYIIARWSNCPGSGEVRTESKEISYPTAPGGSVKYTWYPSWPACSGFSWEKMSTTRDADTDGVPRYPPGITPSGGIRACEPSDPPECSGDRVELVLTRSG